GRGRRPEGWRRDRGAPGPGRAGGPGPVAAGPGRWPGNLPAPRPGPLRPGPGHRWHGGATGGGGGSAAGRPTPAPSGPASPRRRNPGRAWRPERSTLVATHRRQAAGGVEAEVLRRLEVAVALGGLEATGSQQVVEGVSRRGHRHQPGDGPASVGHLDGLAVCDPGEIPAGMLAQLTHTDPIHELHGGTSLAAIPGRTPIPATSRLWLVTARRIVTAVLSAAAVVNGRDRAGPQRPPW